MLVYLLKLIFQVISLKYSVHNMIVHCNQIAQTSDIFMHLLCTRLKQRPFFGMPSTGTGISEQQILFPLTLVPHGCVLLIVSLKECVMVKAYLLSWVTSSKEGCMINTVWARGK